MNKIIGWLIIYSVSMFFIEVEANGIDTPSSGFFLWSERIVAFVFTIEFLVRWYHNHKYIRSLEAVIDLLGFLPFWLGFFISDDSLKWVRVLRVLRLLKFHRYNNALVHFYKAIGKIKDELYLLGFVSVLIIVFGSIVIFEVEKDLKDTKFTKLSDAVWWCVVTLTTIGYGDVYPISMLGRAVAMVIMIVGVGIFGTFISLMGSGFVNVYREERILKEKEK